MLDIQLYNHARVEPYEYTAKLILTSYQGDLFEYELDAEAYMPRSGEIRLAFDITDPLGGLISKIAGTAQREFDMSFDEVNNIFLSRIKTVQVSIMEDQFVMIDPIDYEELIL